MSPPETDSNSDASREQQNADNPPRRVSHHYERNAKTEQDHESEELSD
jgi:hypothetical protein